MKNVIWLGTSLRDLIKLGEDMKDAFGTDLTSIQLGVNPSSVKPLQNGMAEIKRNSETADGCTYRLVHIAKFDEAIYVLHVFNKKSHKDDETPRRDAEIIKSRYAEALQAHQAHILQEKEKLKNKPKD